VSTLGDGIRYVAFPLLAAALTRDPRAVALVFAAGYLPWPLVGLIGGAVVDRVDRRQLMWRTDVARAVLVGCLAALVVTRYPPVALLASASFALGVAETFFDNASSAILPMLVPVSALERANGWLFSAQTISSTLAGAPLGAVLFGLAPASPLVVDAATFVIAAVLVFSLRGRYTARESRAAGTIRGDIAEGLAWLARHRLLRILCLLLCAVNATLASSEAVLVLYTYQVLHIGSLGYSLLLAVLAVGGIIGTVVVPAIRRAVGAVAVLIGCPLGQALALVVAGLTSSLPMAIAALAIFGATMTAWNVVAVSLRQTIVPPQLLGRVTSSYRIVGLSAMPAGAALGGLVARTYGLHAPFLLGGVLLAVVTALCLPWLRTPAGSRPVSREGFR
jgi:predicted MFS family arabinose efflux permease